MTFLIQVLRHIDEFLSSHHLPVCKCSVDVRGNKILITLHYCVSEICVILLAPQELHPLDLKNGVANFINEVCLYMFFSSPSKFTKPENVKYFHTSFWIETKTERLEQEPAITIASILRKNILGYLSVDIICSEK